MDAIIVERETVSSTVNVRDCRRTLLVEGVAIENAVDEVGRILNARLTTRGLELGDSFGFPVFLGELLDAPLTDVEPVGHVLRVEYVVAHQSTDPGDIVYIQFYLAMTCEGSIASTKYFPDCTGRGFYAIKRYAFD